MKKKYVLIMATAAVVATSLIGGTMAFKSSKGVYITEKISEKTLKVKNNLDSKDSLEVIPGGESVVSYNTKNTGSYDMYTRVYVTFDWKQDNKRKELGKIFNDEDMLTLYLNKGSKSNPEYVEIPKSDSEDNVYISSYDEQVKVGDWIITYYDSNQLQMYYTKPLSNGATSSDFLSKIAFSKDMDNKFAEAKLNIESEVQAVQANNEVSAIAAEWGVYPHFTSGNEISYISENSGK